MGTKGIISRIPRMLGMACLASAAHASVVADFNNFCGMPGLSLIGTAIYTGSPSCQLQLTSNTAYESGAAYTTTPFTLGPGSSFTSTFQFQFTDPAILNPADGMVFVLAAAPGGLGTTGGGLGYYGVQNSVGIEFDTYNDGPDDGNSSNHIDIGEDGSSIVHNLTNVYGVQYCDFSSANPYSAAGCLSNGDIWTADLSYNGISLSLSVNDPAEGSTLVIYNNLVIDIAAILGTNTAYAGFTAGTGTGVENQNILDWQLTSETSVPESGSLALLCSAFPALGFAFLWRRKHRMI